MSTKDPLADPDLANLYPTNEQVEIFVKSAFECIGRKLHNKNVCLRKATLLAERRKMTDEAMLKTVIAYCQMADKLGWLEDQACDPRET